MLTTYTYDAFGRDRIDDSGTQTWTVYNGKSADANPYADFNSSGDLQMHYLDGLAVDQVLAPTDSSGNVVVVSHRPVRLGGRCSQHHGRRLDEIIYDPFGNIVAQTDAANADRFMFAGMEYDSTTGLYYDHARYYNSVYWEVCESGSDMRLRAGMRIFIGMWVMLPPVRQIRVAWMETPRSQCRRYRPRIFLAQTRLRPKLILDSN